MQGDLEPTYAIAGVATLALLVGLVLAGRALDRRLSASSGLLAGRFQTEERLRRAYEALGFGVLVQDAAGEITHANAVALELLGAKQDDLRGNTSTYRRLHLVREDGTPDPPDDHPIATEGVGSYPASTDQPSIILFIKGLEYRSVNAGSSGAIVITDWGVETGDVVAGTFEATLVADGPTGKTAAVSGYYHFILPSKESGQPQ